MQLEIFGGWGGICCDLRLVRFALVDGPRQWIVGRLCLLSFKHSRNTRWKPLRLVAFAQLGPVAQVYRLPVRTLLWLVTDGVNVLIHGAFPGSDSNDTYSSPVT